MISKMCLLEGLFVLIVYLKERLLERSVILKFDVLVIRLPCNKIGVAVSLYVVKMYCYQW